MNDINPSPRDSYSDIKQRMTKFTKFIYVNFIAFHEGDHLVFVATSKLQPGVEFIQQQDGRDHRMT